MIVMFTHSKPCYAARMEKLTAAQLTAEHVRRALDYDPITGLLFWRAREDVPRKVNVRFAGKPAGGPDGQYGYITVRLHDRLYQAHRLIWLHVTGAWPEAVLDHIDGNPTNNAWSNLRPATRAENNRNRRTSAGDMRGVLWVKKERKWKATITLARVNYHLGLYDTPDAAHAAYCEAARRMHGEFAKILPSSGKGSPAGRSP